MEDHLRRSILLSLALRNMLKYEKDKKHPQGSEISGSELILIHMIAVVELYQAGLHGPSQEHYVHSVNVLPSGAHVIVGLNAELASLMHNCNVMWIMVDTTFKAVQGEINEWKVVIWTAKTNQHMSFICDTTATQLLISDLMLY